MHGFLTLWRRKDDRPAGAAPPSPVKEQARRIDKSAIGAPTLLSLPRRFEIYAGDHAGPLHRSGSQSSSSGVPSPAIPPAAPPAAHPLPIAQDKVSRYPLIRSYSLPTPGCPRNNASGSRAVASAPPAARANSHSPLHLDTRRPLSPILEQSCASPISIQPVSPISIKPVSPLAESEISTLELSQPLTRPPGFIQRTLSKSQQTEAVAISDQPPSIPPLNLVPYFPGPHPSQNADGPPRRPPKAHTAPLRSSVHSAAGSSNGSLHAESFITAKSVHFSPTADDGPGYEVPLPLDLEAGPTSATSSTFPVPMTPPAPLDRHGTFGSSATGGSSLRRRRQRFSFATPAFCMFCLGFLFPPCWWVGGWYFTFFAEAPAQRTLWEHYVRNTRWWALLTCGFGAWRQTTSDAGVAEKPVAPPRPLLLPRWVHAGNTAPALDGIAYYYPFVSRPPPGTPGYVTTGPAPRGFRRIHRFFDETTRSRLERVKLARESPRRIIDPWIGRCRRALCYWCVVMLLGILGIMAWSFAVGAGVTKY